MLSTILHDPLFAFVTWGELILLAIVMGIVASNLWVLPRENFADPRNILPTLRNRLWLYLGYCLVALDHLKYGRIDIAHLEHERTSLHGIVFRNRYGAV